MEEQKWLEHPTRHQCFDCRSWTRSWKRVDRMGYDNTEKWGWVLPGSAGSPGIKQTSSPPLTRLTAGQFEERQWTGSVWASGGIRQQPSQQLQAHDAKACGQCVRLRNRWTRLPSPADPQRQGFVLRPSARWMNTIILQIAKQKQVFIRQSIPRLPYIPAQTRIFTTKQKCENILFPRNVFFVLILCVYTYESLRAMVHLWRSEEVTSLLPPRGALERFDLGWKMSCPSEQSCWPFSSHLIQNKQTKRSLRSCCREKTP